MGHEARKRALVLLAAGKLRERPDLSKAMTVFSDAGIDAELRASDDFARLVAEAEQAIEDVDLLVAAGGDGTVRTVARLAERSGLPLGLLPLGTANDFARTIGLPANLERAAGIIVDGRTARVDVGVVNDHLFLNVASIGLSESVARHLTGERKRRWGVLSYALAFRDAVRASRTFSVEITCDGRSETLKVIQVGVANGRFHGGGMEVSPDARIDDGRLRAYAIESQPVGKLMVMAASIKVRAHGLWDGIRWFEGRHIELRTTRPKRVNADGELVTKTPATIEIRPKAITVFVAPQFEAS